MSNPPLSSVPDSQTVLPVSAGMPFCLLLSHVGLRTLRYQHTCLDLYWSSLPRSSTSGFAALRAASPAMQTGTIHLIGASFREMFYLNVDSIVRCATVILNDHRFSKTQNAYISFIFASIPKKLRLFLPLPSKACSKFLREASRLEKLYLPKVSASFRHYACYKGLRLFGVKT
jgi:hypothetical protein